MKLQKMFKRSVELGMQADVRDKKYFDRYFKKQKEAMKNAKGWKKDIFDEERTWNPYSDCRIINGSGKEEVTTMN